MRYLQLVPEFGDRAKFGAGVHVSQLLAGIAQNNDRAVVGVRHDTDLPYWTMYADKVHIVNAAHQHLAESTAIGGLAQQSQWFMADHLAYNHALLAMLKAHDEPIDVVHCHDTSMIPVACQLADEKSAPLITTAHIPEASFRRGMRQSPSWLDQHVDRALELEGYRRSKLIIAPSADTAQLLATEYPWCADRLVVMEPPISADIPVKQSYELDGPIKILAVGRIDPNKGFEALASALSRFKRGAVKYVVIGDGPRRAQLLESAAKADVAIELRGRLPHSEVLASYRDADIFVSLSPLETYGMVLQEAMAAGLPVVATDIPAFAERIEAGVNGLLVSADAGSNGGQQASETAAAIESLIDSMALRRRLGCAARERTIQSESSYAARLNDMVRKLL